MKASHAPASAATVADTQSNNGHQFIGGNKHDAKYDRQLRLWGKEGQQALAESHIVAIGVSAAVVEALKSIVLTGVRTFTIVDDALVTDEDIATNFFVLPSDKGQSLAEATARQLSELNADCAALAIPMSPVAWIEAFSAATRTNTPSDARAKLVALMSQAHRAGSGTPDSADGAGAPTLLLVSDRYLNHTEDSPLVAAAKNAPGAPPVLCVQARGLMGFYQAFAHEDLVITMPHPSANEMVNDLRIFNPFPALKAWFDNHDPSNPEQFVDDIVTHSHIPYPSILYRAYAQLCRETPILPPLERQQLKSMQSLVWQMTRRKEPVQEAFAEAAEKCTTSLNSPYRFSSERPLVKLWHNPRAHSPNMPPLPFHDRHRTVAEERTEVEQTLAWYITRAIREFTSDNSPADRRFYVLPLCGHLPDFTATTQFFQELRTIYQQKHHEDAADIATRAWACLNETDTNRCALASYPAGGDEVRGLLEQVAKTMVQNVWHLTVAPFATHGEATPSRDAHQRLGRMLQKSLRDDDNAMVVAMAGAVDQDSRGGNARRASTAALTDADIATAASTLLRNVESLLHNAFPPDPSERVAPPYTEEQKAALGVACEEIARVGKVEVPSVAATMGALASQEAIKLIQHRRVPVHTPVVYNGYVNKLYTLTPY